MRFSSAALALIFVAAACGSDALFAQTTVSNLASDERIVFLRTDANLTPDGKQWRVPLHVWVHELESARAQRAAVSISLRAKYRLRATPETQANFDRRVRLLAADNERGKRIVVNIAGQRLTLPETASNGHSQETFLLSAAAVSKYARDGVLKCYAALRAGDMRQFSGEVRLVPPRGVSVISDLDDTVKMTFAVDRAKMLAHTLFKDFEAAPGMADLYRDWAEQGAVVHFVSSSPWHLYEPLDEFLASERFPIRTWSLKYFRFKDRSLLNLFHKGTETKRSQIEPILQTFPQREFVLVGDSGQEDPEVYAAIMREYPKQVLRIYIRNVTGASPDDERFREVFEGMDPQRWQLFGPGAPDPEVVTLPK